MREFRSEDLADFNGKDGKPVYIAHGGKVYDVTESKLWKDGLHMRRHHAGTDLSVDLQAAPHGTEVLERYPQVGVLMEESREPFQKLPEAVARYLDRYPFLQRHPHPMTVHFPIVFSLSAAAFTLLYLITGVKSLETTALHCLAGGVLFMPVVILTGLFTWWVNYMARPSKAVHVKLLASLPLFLFALVAFVWRVSNPEILDSLSFSSVIYVLLIFSMAPLVSLIGWHGAHLTFPTE